MNLVTFNILGHLLATREVFDYCDEKYLDTEYRQKNIKNKLLEFISEKSIICLQEIGNTWTTILLPFFHKNNYFYIKESYGKADNDYMGIAIAFPIDKYEIVEYKAQKISDIIKNDYKIQSDQETIDRNNIAQSIKLRDNQNKIFKICNYHVPCKYRNEICMMLHCYYYIKFGLSDIYNETVFFCGDYNINPGSEMYKMITDKNYDKNEIHGYGLNSLYKLYNNKEPDFTNFVYNKSKLFKETIDYIFVYNYNKNNIGSVLTIEPDEPLPYRDHSSDHIYILAKNI